MPTITVPLTQGKSTVIDAADWPLICDRHWNLLRTQAGCLYAATWIRQPSGKYWVQLLHRLLLDPPPGMLVDHRNGDGLDNRRANLRLATESQNHFNAGKHSHNTSGYKGVTWDKERQKWLAQIRAYKRQYFLGRFTDPIAAARAYDAKCRELHGAFAVLNFPDISPND